MKKNNDRVLITGASRGIGLELARVFARNGHSLILTSPVESELAAVARELTYTYGAEVLFVAQNLLKPQAAAQLYSAIQGKRLRIGVLVNIAGVGYKGAFVHQSLQHQTEMIRLNIESVVAMTRLFLPDMIARGEGRILNVASTASDRPAPLTAIYDATKAFLLSFSEAVATEIKDTGVTMTAVCPSSVDTDFLVGANAVETAASPTVGLMSPQALAEEGYDALMKGERFRIAGGMNQDRAFSTRHEPEFLLAKIAEGFYADVKEGRQPGESGNIRRRATVDN